MRRSLLILVLSVICLAVAPAPADAWFWKWIDDLSGPQFQGFSLEVRVACIAQSEKTRREVIKKVADKVHAERDAYLAAAKAATTRQAEFAFLLSAAYSNQAITHLKEALRNAGDLTKAEGSLERSVRSRFRAELSSRYGHLLAAAAIPGDSPLGPEQLQAIESLVAQSDAEPIRAQGTGAIISGGAISLCELRHFDINRAFVSIDLGYGWDTKKENAGKGIRMYTFGASYRWVPKPYVTLGAGGGMAMFYAGAAGFPKPYVQALVDVKPFSLFRDPRFRSPWWHTVYLRGSATTFPGGFEQGRFPGMRDRFKTEVVESWGVFFDFEPLMRQRKKRWWQGTSISQEPRLRARAAPTEAIPD